MTVLVTGGRGYVAGWCIAALLDRGEAVRTTVRDLAQAPPLRARFGERLDVVPADLLSDDGWAAATKGCDRVLHVASPMGRPGDGDLVRPAREGALRKVGHGLYGAPETVRKCPGACGGRELKGSENFCGTCRRSLDRDSGPEPSQYTLY